MCCFHRWAATILFHFAAFIANTAETSQSIVWLFIAKDLCGGDASTSDSTVSIVLIAIDAGIVTGIGIVVLIIVFMAVSTVDKRKRKAIKHAAARAEREMRLQQQAE